MDVNERGRDTIASFYYKGERIIRSRVPHGQGDLKGLLPHFVRQQLKLNEDQLREILSCKKGYKDYVEILTEKGCIS